MGWYRNILYAFCNVYCTVCLDWSGFRGTISRVYKYYRRYMEVKMSGSAPHPPQSNGPTCAGIFKQCVGSRNRVGIGLSYRHARFHSLAELVPWNWFLGSLKVWKFRLWLEYRWWLLYVIIKCMQLFNSKFYTLHNRDHWSVLTKSNLRKSTTFKTSSLWSFSLIKEVLRAKIQW